MDIEDYNQILDKLLIGTDMADDVSRKMAYNPCLGCAEKLLADDPTVNVFVALAAERLGQVHVYFDVIKNRVSLPENARLRLRYSKDAPDPELTGNTEGLRYLSSLCTALADSLLIERPGSEEHIHLDKGEPPLWSDSYGLTIYRSADAWFDRYPVATDKADADGTVQNTPLREITPEQIAALEFLEEESTIIPPVLYFHYGKVYRVLNCRPYSPSEGIPSKMTESGNIGRMHVFTFRDDAQEIFEITLDLDDAGIHYFTRSDLQQVWEMGAP